jgi:protein-tyrosine-phosphatase
MHAVLQNALPQTVVMSAGFYGSGRAVPATSLELTSRRGLDLSEFRSRPLTPAAVRSADLVIAMDAIQAREILTRFPIGAGRIVIAGDLDATFDVTRGIRDPWGQTTDVFEAVFHRLDRCAATLVRAISDERVVPAFQSAESRPVLPAVRRPTDLVADSQQIARPD